MDGERVSIERATLERIRRSMGLLQQNSEGCAMNHYGGDSEQFGMPGWLADTKADFDILTKALFEAPDHAS